MLIEVQVTSVTEISISGGSLEEIHRETSVLHRAETLAESELVDIFEDVLVVRNTLRDLTKSRSVRRNKIESEVPDSVNVYQCLQLLQAYDLASTGGQGGNWKYTG